MNTIKVLLVDNSSMNRSVIKQKLNSFVEIEVVGECAERALVLNFLELKLIDVVLMDGSVGREEGIETVKLIKLNYPEIKVVVLSSVIGSDYVDEMIDAGASFLDKWEVTFDELKQTIISDTESLAMGGVFC